MKRVLMIAFHFPPLAGSSGIQRTLRFVQHLPAFGWEPIVLTAHPRAYEAVSQDLVKEIPSAAVVERPFALDTARHLSLSGKYPGFLARPDRWLLWRYGAVRAGLRLIKRYKPSVLWSTYPIATAHLIGSELHRRSGIPWIADFRDPMAQDGYPADPETWRSFKAIEERAIRQTALSVFTTPGAARMYRDRYPDVPVDRLSVIENGYDEQSFAGLEPGAREAGALVPGVTTLLHSGIVYPSERDPTQLFQALGSLKRRREIRPERLQIRLRAPVHDAFLHGLAKLHDIADLIQVLPPVEYQVALTEMIRADGLLVLQASNCNEQIPAKLYEYLRAGRPILGLTDPRGDTAEALRNAGIHSIAPLHDSLAIEDALARFIDEIGSGHAPLPSVEAIRQSTRAARARVLAAHLTRIGKETPT